jgi:hypothetical protein
MDQREKTPDRQKKKPPVGTRFFVPAQTGTEAHTASCAMITGFLSRGLKRPGRGVDQPPPFSTEVRNE